MPTMSEYTFLSCNGKTPIYVRRWDPDAAPRAAVQLAHGIAEHIKRYDDFALFLAQNGFVVFGNDHLGHGQSIMSGEDLGFIAENGGWELLVGDMHKLHEQIREEFPDIPCFLFGHSMGSFLARTYMIRYRSGLTGVILSGTAQQPKAVIAGGLLVGSAEVRKHGKRYKSRRLNDMAFGKYNDGITPQRTLSDWISRDEAQVDKYVSDPLCGYIPSAGLFLDMMGGLSFIESRRNTERMHKELSVYFISGDRDPVGENGRGVMRAYRSFLKAGMADVTLKLYHGCRHELLNELNRREVFSDILNWLESKIKA